MPISSSKDSCAQTEEQQQSSGSPPACEAEAAVLGQGCWMCPGFPPWGPRVAGPAQPSHGRKAGGVLTASHSALLLQGSAVSGFPISFGWDYQTSSQERAWSAVVTILS